MNLNNQKRLHNCDYVNSLWISPFINKRFWDSFQNHLITNNFIKKIQKQEKVIELLNSQMLDNRNYLTLKDLDQDQKHPVFEYLKKLVPSVFQDGVLNFDLLKQHLNPDEKIIQNTRNFLGLDWATKEKAKLEYSKNVKNKTLLPDVNRSLNFDQAKNILIEGDNLEALKILQSAYQKQVDVIYIDPPYNTGNDFVYNDNFKQNSYEYKIANGLIDENGLKTSTNQKTNPRLHNNWLDMIYPRLKIARDLLKEDGVIFISIDDNEQARLKLICDEIFGEENFVANIIFNKTSQGTTLGNEFKKTHEFILCYKKSNKFILEMEEINDDSKFVYEDEISKYAITNKLNSINSFLNTNKNRGYTIYYNDKENDVLIKYEYDKETFEYDESYDDLLINKGYIPIRPGLRKGKQTCWNWTEERFLRDWKQEIVFKKEKNGNYFPYHKNRFSGFKNPITIQTFDTRKDGAGILNELFGEIIFDYSKPISLLKWILKRHTNKNALVLDFFAGSGTTAQAVMELNQEDGGNRKYILVQLPEPIENNPEFKTICDITKARIIRSIEKYQYNDLGFKYFKVGLTNFQIWKLKNDDSDETIESQLNVFESLNSNQNYESMLYELMIKQGMRLDENIQLHQIDNYQFWADEFFDYLFFLKPTNPDNMFAIIKKIIENKEQEGKTRIYINETYFDDLKGDEIKLNLAEQINQYKKESKKEIQLVVV